MFFRELDGFFEKTRIASESQKVVNLTWEAYQMVLFDENVCSPFIMRFLRQKITKLSTLEKLENMMQKECSFEKKVEVFSKALLTGMGKNKLVAVAGSLV